ncbi:MAG: diguanylate cyclase [Spirochaetes bacterium]|jgi:two-component system cell cycle response regulator|nr:diguanylate cyclase [Spirochaetota bacterium]
MDNHDIEAYFKEMLSAEKSADYSIITSLEKKVYDMKNLIEIGISLSSNLEFSSLVDAVLYSCIGQLFIDKITILLQVDIDTDCYYIHSHKGYDPASISEEVILKENSALTAFLQEHPEPHDYEALKAVAGLRDDLKAIDHLSPILVVPMKSKNYLNGIILVGNKMLGTPFTTDEKEFLRQLSRFSATAVENSRLYLMATQDRMTRLYVHHFFQDKLVEEMKRSDRSGEPLSLFITDIDHFKKFNDVYGHQQGDIVLKEVARLMKDSMRATDCAARYGGEEFAVILPGASLDMASDVANRLRKEIEKYEFSGQTEPLHVAISVGVAQYDPKRDLHKEDLIERADKALYKAKESGRNRVAVFK